MAGSIEVRVPDMGNFKDVAVIDVLVKAGDTIEVETPLVTLETEKATMDVPSTAAGVVEKVHVAKGGKVSAGDCGRHGARGSGEAPQAAATPKAASEADALTRRSATAGVQKPMHSTVEAPRLRRHRRLQRAAPHVPQRRSLAADRTAPGAPRSPGARNDLPPIDEPGFSRAHAGPSVRKLARELGVDLAQCRAPASRAASRTTTSRRSSRRC